MIKNFMRNLFLSNFISLTNNFILIFFLFLGIQNSQNKHEIVLVGFKTIPLPNSFIIGTSFILGSLSANLINIIAKSDSKNNI